MNAHQAPTSRSCQVSQRSETRIVAEAKSVKEREWAGFQTSKPFQHPCSRHFARGTRLAYALGMRFVLGFDGGGTKTECVLMDETGEGRAKGRSGPSHPVRVGCG